MSNDMPELYDRKEVKARKDHKCSGCLSTIEKGSAYLRTKGMWNGDFESFAHCGHCSKILQSPNKFDECISYDEGPSLDSFGVGYWFQGYQSRSYKGLEVVIDIVRIFDVPEDYARRLMGIAPSLGLNK